MYTDIHYCDDFLYTWVQLLLYLGGVYISKYVIIGIWFWLLRSYLAASWHYNLNINYTYIEERHLYTGGSKYDGDIYGIQFYIMLGPLGPKISTVINMWQ